MRPGRIDILQYIVKGSILKKHKFIAEHHMADGVYAQMLSEKYRDEILFLPNLYGFFNYFQPGRYTKPEAFLKPTWKLPQII